ncbi:hypothetical protein CAUPRSCDRAFT_12735 [Caulochytrium protostelioides]|nr:hypothetical protein CAUPRSCDRAFT_12735 [Caulochytrium protostelioides]
MCTDLFVPACQSYPCVSGANVEPSYVCSAATQFTKTFGLCLCPSGLVAIPPFVNPTSTPSLPVASSASDSSAQSVIAMHGIAKAVAGAMVAAAGISTLFL